MSIIKTIMRDPGLIQSTRRIAYVTKEPLPKEEWYIHKETKQEYWHICAGIAHQTHLPGAVVVVGARKSEPIVMEAIGASAGTNLRSLFKSAVTVRKRFRSNDVSLLRIMWGDPKKFTGLISDFNKVSNQIEKIFITAPPDWKSLNPGLTYWRTIENYGQANPMELHLSGCPDLHAALNSVVGTGLVGKNSVKDFPPSVMALGYAIHAMRAHKPWINKDGRPRYMTADPLDMTGWAEKEAMDTLYGTGELEGFDDDLETVY